MQSKVQIQSRIGWSRFLVSIQRAPLFCMCTSAQCALRTTIQNCFISCPSSSTNPTLLQCIDFCFFCIDQRFQFSSALPCIGSHSASLCNWFIQFEVGSFSLIIFYNDSMQLISSSINVYKVQN